MSERPLTVAWISFFPLEWLPDLPAPLRDLPRGHPASWQRVLLDELKHVPALKVHVLAVRNQYPSNFTFERGGVSFHTLHVPGRMRLLSLFWWETLGLRRCLRQIQPDLIHAWGTERGAALVASRCPYPYLLTLQGLTEWCLELVELGTRVRIEARLERSALQRATIATVESCFGLNWLREHYPHLELRQVEHAPNWLFHSVERRPEIKPLRFLFIGTPSPLKGTDLLIQGLDRLRSEFDFRLTIVSSDNLDYLQQLRNCTSAALWERVALRPKLTQPEVAEELARATLVLFPTRVDNSPNSVKESAVAGVPVVASAIGGIPDYITSGLNGITFRPGNLEEFIKAIRAAAAHPAFSQGKVDSRTLKEAREYLSPAVMAEKFMSAYQRVLERAGRSNLRARELRRESASR